MVEGKNKMLARNFIRKKIVSSILATVKHGKPTSIQKKNLVNTRILNFICGERGIRTLGTVTRTHV